MTEVFLCPVCQGKGLVANGFYSAIGVQTWTTSSITPEKCKSCDGEGIIVVRDTHIFLEAEDGKG